MGGFHAMLNGYMAGPHVAKAGVRLKSWQLAM